MMSMALTSKTGYKSHCGPFAPEVYRLPFPNRFRYGDDLPEDEFVDRELARLEEFFLVGVAADQVAAVILETVQGEGGFVPVPVGYLRGLRKICDERGIVLILDEVQSGFGRTGRWAAYEHYGVTPDLSTWVKSMGGGLPISAVVGKAEIMNAAQPGTLGGTYGGNPISCAAALATIAAMEEEKLNERGAEIGRRTFAKFRELQKQCDLVADVRGLGAMAAIELCFHKNPLKPATAVTNAVAARCLDQGVIVLPCSPHGNVIRVLSPLTISWDDLDRGLEVLCESVVKAAREAHSTV
jgi:4-aminobutyrate aminotransferase/(S)-3-amino-2-methylpropionate transaminase